MKKDLITQERIARTFSKVLLDWLGEAKLREVISLNKADENSCHTHDFCDSNMAMDEAMKSEGFTDEQILHNAEFHPLWDKAWRMARENNFFLKPATFDAGSSHGTVVAEKETGKVVQVLSINEDDPDNYIKNIVSLDVKEYKEHYKITEMEDHIDILSIGFTLKDGTTEEAAHSWREELEQLRKGELEDGNV